jgi:hypothetical protein
LCCAKHRTLPVAAWTASEFHAEETAFYTKAARRRREEVVIAHENVTSVFRANTARWLQARTVLAVAG